VLEQGVGSSLEGHTIALKGGIVMNMTRMARIVDYHEGDQQVVVQAGIRRVELNNQLKDKNVFFPIDPGADASVRKSHFFPGDGVNLVMHLQIFFFPGEIKITLLVPPPRLVE